MSRNRKIARRDKPKKRIRVLDGNQVFPTRYQGRINGHSFSMMAATTGKDGEIVKNSVGEPIPFQAVGELVWK